MNLVNKIFGKNNNKNKDKIQNDWIGFNFSLKSLEDKDKIVEIVEPKTLANMRLEGNANDYGSGKGIKLYNSHKLKMDNQWVNPFSSVNTGYGTAHLSLYMYQPVNYYQCAVMAQDPLFARLFSILSDEPLAKGGEIRTKDTKEDKFFDEIDVLVTRYKIIETVKLALKKSYSLGGCLVLKDCGSNNLELPFRKSDYKKFKGFRIIEPMNCTAVDVNTTEPAKENYMDPDKWYIIGLGVVHKSHVIKFSLNEPEEFLKPICMYLGMPLTQILKQDVANSNLASQGLANMMNRFRNIYLKVDDTNFTGSGASNFRSRLEAMGILQDNFNVTPLKKDEDVVQLVSSIAGMNESVELFYQIVASKSGVHFSKLFKTSQGLNNDGEGDRTNHYDNLKAVQSYLSPKMVEMYNIIGKIYTQDDDFEFIAYDFNELEIPTPKEKADLIKAHIEAGKNLTEMGAKREQVFEWIKRNKEFDLEDIELDLETDFLDEYEEKEVSVHNEKFIESDHTRDEDGKFTSTGYSRDTSEYLSKETKDFLGEKFEGFKGRDAIDKLMGEKRGYVPNAFSRKDIGDVSLIWGDDEMGLQHIIKRRKETNQPIGRLFESLTEVIEKGNISEGKKGRFEINYKGKLAIIEPKLYNETINFLFTAYYER
ncbi:MAG: anti-CBASS protein Acb1 family protein [Alphaproteobacteria bacterium]